MEKDGRRRKKRQIKGEREKEKRQEEEKGGSMPGGEARNGTVLTGLMIGKKKVQYIELGWLGWAGPLEKCTAREQKNCPGPGNCDASILVGKHQAGSL